MHAHGQLPVFSICRTAAMEVFAKMSEVVTVEHSREGGPVGMWGGGTHIRTL